MTALMLSALLALPAQAADDDPEPPVKKGIVVRLVAKKTTYKLDYGGLKKEDYVTAAKNGTASALPVDLEFVIVNYTKGDVRIRVGGSAARLVLNLKGDGAVESPSTNTGARPKLTYHILKPGQKHSIPITTLTSYERAKAKAKGDRHHYWTEPGEYTLGASLTTVIYLDQGNPNVKSQTTTLTAKPITLKVEK